LGRISIALHTILGSAFSFAPNDIRTIPGRPDSPLATVQKAATELEQAAEETTHGPPVSRGVQRVQIEKPKFDVKDHLWSGTLGLFDDLKPVGEFLGA